ncbi:MAG: hypothetical protein K2N60_05425 [Oscillospiraceae bacterium]|nr:hypothetical protein [Oscillospiraceae bacterium]
MVQESRKELLKLYQSWKSELKDVCPQLLCKEFSYPYYLHIPDDWYERKFRVLIVGEEGHGFKHKDFDMPIECVQTFNREYIAGQLEDTPDTGCNRDPLYKRNNSAFWNRIRKIKALRGPNEISLTWTNLDKIHRLGSKCALKKEQRLALHQTPTAILSEEITLLKPTVVIFFGWYGVSLEKELPSVFKKLYPNGLGDNSQWRKEKMKAISENDICYIFTYHPNWGQRQKGYEEKILSAVNDAFTEAAETRRCLKQHGIDRD